MPTPASGMLPDSARLNADQRDFGVYIHVPFCAVRCGYCDFNTYTAAELRGVSQDDYPGHAAEEIRFAAGVLESSGLVARPASTIFFGGGTPTLLRPESLAMMLKTVRDSWGIAAGAEITVEANPDSVDAGTMKFLADAGFTRVSFGMQSAVPSVLATLERTHDPDRIPEVVSAARDAGLSVSLDLIYGTPGESLAEWETSLRQALATSPDHLSAYALIVEEGTRLARQIRQGEYPLPDDDLQADMYELADDYLSTAGYEWYEISNWSTSEGTRSRHNRGYWLGHDWWGIGPGAHSHVGGVRWWNAKHPAAYAARVTAGESPAVGRECLSDDQIKSERVMLLPRLREGLLASELDPNRRGPVIASLIADELIQPDQALTGRIVLTRRGRLLADAVVRYLMKAIANG